MSNMGDQYQAYLDAAAKGKPVAGLLDPVTEGSDKPTPKTYTPAASQQTYTPTASQQKYFDWGSTQPGSVITPQANQVFDNDTYLQNQANYMNNMGADQQEVYKEKYGITSDTWTPADIQKALDQEGTTAQQDFALYGAKRGVNGYIDKPRQIASAPAPAQAKLYNVNPTTQTAQGQMNGLLADNSKYMQLARQQAKEQANQAGLLNTTLAETAGERAAIESALPIAQQDANTYFAQSNLNQNAENNFSLFNKEFQYNDYFKDVDFNNTSALNAQQNQATIDLQRQQDAGAFNRQKLQEDSAAYR